MDRRQFLKSFSPLFFYPLLTARSRALTLPISETATKACDIHIHLLGTSEDNGCYVNPEYQRTMVYRIVELALDTGGDLTPEEQDRQYVESLISMLGESSQHVSGILLSMDGVYDGGGKIDLEQTSFYVPNDYLFEVCRRSSKMIPGASVSPFRSDALDELDRVAELGAVLIKWIPNSQNIDPSDSRIKPFYRRLSELRLPLLTHCGVEFAVGSINQSYGDPALLEQALENGVEVIVAHCAVDGWDHRGFFFNRFLDMLEEYPNLWGDISALTMLHKSHRLRYLLDHPDLFDRLYYGSDFPLQFFPATSPLYFLGRLQVESAFEIQEIPNPLVRDLETLKALRVPEKCFSNGLNLVNRA